MAKKPARSPLPSFAICLLLLACGFTFFNGNVSWFWDQTPWVAGLLVVVGLTLGAWYFVQRSHHSRRTSNS